MGRINVGRWIVAGLVAGVVFFVIDFIVNDLVLGQEWAAFMQALGRPAFGTGDLIVFIVLDLMVGLAAVWIYVGIRPRFGPGHTTAVYAGLAAWVLAYFFPEVFVLTAGIFPPALAWAGVIVGLIQMIVATVVGAYFYQEA
jgi:hypothetical protein